MCLKNSGRQLGSSVRPASAILARRPAYSLRLRLIRWYGSLLTLGLICFALLVLILVQGVTNANMQNAVSAETNIATHNLNRVLLVEPPYWPPQLEMDALDTYHTPGLTIEIFTMHRNMLYASDASRSLGLDSSVVHDLVRGTTPIWYKANVSGDQALVQASAIYPSSLNMMDNVAVSNTHPPIIGVLLVAKSLHDTNNTLMLLQGLLLLTGVIILVLFLGCGWAIIGYALRPLSELVKTSSSIAAMLAHGTHTGNLSQRVMMRPAGNDEMAQVVDAFNEMLTSIESSTAVQRRFIADASHELRAPLTTIQGNLAFLQRNSEAIPSDERHTMLTDAHGETLRLASLVEELLLLARADANMGQTIVPALPAPIVELDRTLLKLVRQIRPRLEIECASPTIEIGGIEPVRVRGDEESMRRIMVILLDNAIKYTRTEECKGKITVALQRVNGQAVLRVSDTGIGIEAKDLPHIFERFYRADLARSREGTGLGLAIAQTLIEQLDGSITATSTPGKGSTFRMSLPLV
ncbi:MAG: HAMP domain-containing sensor histidine kinase [Ktedonobacteraceae bacterium]